MKKLLFTLVFTVAISFPAMAQFATESYTAYKVTGSKIPVVDGTIEPVWENVTMVPLTKVPETGGAVHPNIIEPSPTADDYYAEIGMVWNDDGIFFLFKVVDDIVVIEEDYDPNNDTPADQWWVDDNINILFSRYLEDYSQGFEQWEFAWQPGIDQEEKLSSDRWLNAAKIDSNLVQSAWYNDGTTWILETFIDWQSFGNGNMLIDPEMVIYLEARARDDDDSGPWETMFQWSSINYDVESTGEGMGAVTLSGTELAVTGIFGNEEANNLRLYPNPASETAELEFAVNETGLVNVNVLDLSGRSVMTTTLESTNLGTNTVSLNVEALESGLYYVQVRTAETSSVAKFMRQ